jgi:hypothetical protein
MAISRPLLSLIVLVIYIAIFIPLVLPVLLSMFIDFVNNSELFNIEYCATRIVKNETGDYTQIVECTQQDLSPLVIFLFQLVVYFGIPLIILWRAFSRR